MIEPFNFGKKTDQKKTKRTKQWQKQEDAIAEKIKGKVQPGSGNIPFKKGDIKSSLMLVEAKQTDAESMSIKMEWLRKIDNEAVAYKGRIPGLGIRFSNMHKGTAKDWVLLPMWAVEALLFGENSESR